MKKCPPGIICIENFTLIFMVICIILLFYVIYSNVFKQNIENKNNIVIHDSQRQRPYNNIDLLPSYPYSNLPTSDVLLNPYTPPLRDERYFNRVPINISTNAIDTNYRQVGILTPIRGNKEKILPLMGRPLYTRRDLWQYYTMSDSNNSVKLPIRFKGKNATNEYGVDQIYGESIVYVEGYDKAFKVTIYENDVIKYIPFL